MSSPTVPQRQPNRNKQVKRDLMTKSVFDNIKSGAAKQKQYSKDKKNGNVKKYERKKDNIFSDAFLNANAAEPIWKYSK